MQCSLFVGGGLFCFQFLHAVFLIKYSKSPLKTPKMLYLIFIALQWKLGVLWMDFMSKMPFFYGKNMQKGHFAKCQV